ncbi:MAG: hypothetical protein GY803_10800 [Chloroflexi bacterium]|nr:hypothetical protein [Chloroflexota bacterium]
MTMALLLAACGVEANDVPSLQDAQSAADEASVADPGANNEALMMAFTECLREQGLDVADPMVDADGNIGKPELVDGGSLDKEALGAAMEICGERLEGFTFGKKRGDVSEQVDQFLALAACLRDKGYNVADPTAETLDQWMADFKNGIDWDDPTAVSDYEICSGETVGAGGKK